MLSVLTPGNLVSLWPGQATTCSRTLTGDCGCCRDRNLQPRQHQEWARNAAPRTCWMGTCILTGFPVIRGALSSLRNGAFPDPHKTELETDSGLTGKTGSHETPRRKPRGKLLTTGPAHHTSSTVNHSKRAQASPQQTRERLHSKQSTKGEGGLQNGGKCLRTAHLMQGRPQAHSPHHACAAWAARLRRKAR